MERETEEDALDGSRESAIASAASLRPNFKPKGGISSARLSKFQELHKRRLQIKAKSKVHKRDKGLSDGKGKSHTKAMESHALKGQEPREQPLGHCGSHSISENKVDEEATHDSDHLAGNVAPKRRQKLYWGLDTKERWERKSNM